MRNDSRVRTSLSQINHNVLFTFVYKFSDGIAQGVWSAASMATYIYILENKSTKYVGLAQGIQGTCVALSAIPAGWLADRFRRDRVLILCALASCIAIACTCLAVFMTQEKTSRLFGVVVDDKFLWLCLALAMWGIGQGAGPVVEALLADSTPTGARSKVYASMFSAGLTGMAIGPCAAAATFAITGNAWQINTLENVILVGMVLALVPIGTLLFFNDDSSLGAESDALRLSRTVTENDAALRLSRNVSMAEEKMKAAMRRKKRSSRTQWIPYILAVADVAFGAASGMTIKFFPIFFLEQVALPPVGTNFVMAGTPLAIAVMSSLVTPKIAQYLGRPQTVLLVKYAGVGLLALMGLAPHLWTNLLVIVPVYIVRTAVINSAYPLQKSILMDYVPKESRARWNSLDGVLIFGWSGSAFLGGILLDKYGFSFIFLVTAVLQAVGTSIMLPLLLLVPRNEKGNKPSAGASAAALAAVGAGAGLAGQDVEVLTDGYMADLNAATDLEESLIGTSHDTGHMGVLMPVPEDELISATEPPAGTFPVGSPYFPVGSFA